jgi:GNAT superfamily N-acetyltransferase
MRLFLNKFFWRLRYPWLPAWLQGRVRALRLTWYTPERITDCLELYDRNAVHGVPSAHREHYERTLRNRSILTLLAEDDSGVVGTFGLQYGFQPHVLWICYVFVAPEQHRRGIGVTLMLAALGLLPHGHQPMTVAVSALPTALRFYERFGFRQAGETPFDDGEMHPLAILAPVTRAMGRDCRKILRSAGATLPGTILPIPTAKLPPAEMGAMFSKAA